MCDRDCWSRLAPDLFQNAPCETRYPFAAFSAYFIAERRCSTTSRAYVELEAMMAILKDDDRKQLTKIFEQLTNPVKLVLFTQDVECDYCQITHEMVDEVCSISPKLSLEVKDFVKDEAEAEKMGVDKIPAIAIIGDKDYGIRMFGVPSGYEFSTLVESIIDVSLRRHGLPANVLDELAKVDKPVRMQVLITPT